MANVKGFDDYDVMPQITGIDIVPSGGTIGYVLTKDSGTSYDYSWQPTSAVGSLNDLSDVTITTPATDDALIYNGSLWVNTPITNGAASKQMNSWTLLSGTLYYNDFVHNLGTDEISVYIYDTVSGQGVRGEYTEIIDTNTLRVVVKGNGEDLTTNVVSGRGPTGPAGPQGPAGGGATDLISLTDVNSSTPTNKNFLVADGVDWESRQIGLTDLSDVNTATVTNRNVLVADGVDFESRALVEADISDFGSYALATHTHTYRFGHTYAISGEIQVPSGDTDFILPFYVSFATGQTASIVKARHSINSGTSATVKLTRNGGDIAGYTGITVNTTPSDTTQTQALTDNDELALVVTAVAGAPTNMSFTIFIEYTQ